MTRPSEKFPALSITSHTTTEAAKKESWQKQKTHSSFLSSQKTRSLSKRECFLKWLSLKNTQALRRESNQIYLIIVVIHTKYQYNNKIVNMAH